MHGDHPQSFAQGDVVQLDINSLWFVVQVKQHVDSSQLANRFIDIIRRGRHAQGKRSIRKGFQIDRTFSLLYHFAQWRLRRRGNHLAFLLFFEHGRGASQLLLGGNVGDVNLRRKLKFRERFG